MAIDANDNIFVGNQYSTDITMATSTTAEILQRFEVGFPVADVACDTQ